LGIMRLLESGKLKMTDKVFGPGALLGTDYGTQPYPPYITAITVKNLLQHEAGGWDNSSNDPAFAQSTLNVNQLISWVIDNRPLTSTPGTKSAYSNQGYLILGAIIEKLSGKSY